MMFWTEEKTASARDLWREGRSAAEIAALLDAPSRAAVLGKLQRLGLLGNRRLNRQTETRKRDGAASKQKARASALKGADDAAPVVSLAPISPAERDMARQRPAAVVQLFDLGPGQCRYPFSDAGAEDFGFCGAPVMRAGGAALSSYCAAHHALCLVAPDRRLARAMARSSAWLGDRESRPRGFRNGENIRIFEATGME